MPNSKKDLLIFYDVLDLTFNQQELYQTLKLNYRLSEIYDLKSYKTALKQSPINGVVVCSDLKKKSVVNALKKNFSSLPHILITSQHCESKAIDLFKSGLKDYFFDNNLLRLIPVIKKELECHDISVKTSQNIEILKANNKIYNSYINQAPLAIITWDLDFNVLGWNKMAEQIFGYSKEEAVGKSAFELIVIQGKFKEAKAAFKAILNQKNKSENTVYSKRKTGNNFLCRWSNTLLKDEAGKTIGVISSAEDVTEEKLFQDKILKNQQFLQQAQALSDVYNIEISLDSQRVFLDKTFIKLSGLPQKEHYKPKYLLKHLIHPEDHVKLLKAYYLSIKNNSKLAVDIRVLYDKNEVRWINILADTLQDNISKRRSLLGTFIDITERKRELLQLKEHQDKLDLSMDIAELGFLSFDIKTNTVEMSGNARKIFDLNATNKTVFTIDEAFVRIHPDDRNKVKNAFNQCVKKHKPYQIKHRLLYPNGDVIWINALGKLILDKDKNSEKIVGIVRDITNQINRERRLLQHSLILNQINSLVLVMDKNTNFTFASPSISKLTGYSIEDILGSGWWEKSYITQKERDNGRQYFKSIINHTKTINSLKYERKVVCKDGSIKWFAWHFSKGTENSIIGLARDVTQDKEKEHLVSKLFKAIENSPTIVVITDIKGHIEFVNPKFEEVTGYTSKEVIGLTPSVLKSGYTSQDDYKELWKTISRGDTWHGIFKNIKKNGDYFWEKSVITPVKNEEGIITNFIALKEDITEQVHQEKKFLYALFEAQENEKLKFGEELHDSLSQILSAMSFYLDAVLNPKNTKDHLKLEYLEKVKSLTDDALRESRHISHGLMSKQLIQGGLEAATLEICNNYNVSKKISFTFKNLGYKETYFDIEKKQNIFRIIQEITTNIVRHSGATKANIKFNIFKDEFFVLEIKDNGVGIDLDMIKQKSKSFGLKNIEQRVTLLNGTLKRQSETKKGVLYQIKIPLEKENI